MAEFIRLKGGDIHYTGSSSDAYEVLEGVVLVYLVPDKDGKEGRRLLLAEIPEKGMIPGMSNDSALFGKWKIGLVALDRAVLIKHENASSDMIRMAFAKEAGIKLISPENFEPMLIERYELACIKEEGAIFGTQVERQRTKERTLRLIASQFVNNSYSGSSHAAMHTGKQLYDAAAFLCMKERIDIAPIERIRETSGTRFKLDDIARVSHFVTREVILGEGWHKRDSGPFMVWRKKDRQPMVCIPKGPRRYLIFDPKTERIEKLTAEIADGLDSRACMFYRPFPAKAIGKRDLFLFGMQKVYRSDIARLVLMAVLGTLVGLLIPLLNKQVYDRFIPTGNQAGLLELGALMLACALGNISFTIVKNLASFRSMNTQEYAVQAATFDRLFHLPGSFFRGYDAAGLGQRAMGISMIYKVLAQNAVMTALSALLSLLYLWRMFRYSKKLANWSLVMLAAVSAVIVISSIRQMKYERSKRDADLESQTRSFQFISGIAKIRNAWAEDRALYRYMDVFTASIQLNIKKEGITIRINAFVQMAQIIFSLVFYYIMIRKQLELSVGSFTAFTAAFGSFSAAVLSAMQSLLVINQIRPLYEDAKPILETLPEISEDADMPGELNGEIDLSNITFAYEKGMNPVISGLNMHINAGEYIGIVGSSGCGKSTLLKLLLGFEKPQIGSVYYDGRDIEGLDKRELRKKFGVVLQDGGLIAGSIADNIKIASPNVRMRRLEEAIREVGLEEDIKRMPMGLHTVVSEGAGTISGGQKQRILIARAIVGKPKVIFLDEATSALDNVTQKQVVDTLEKLDSTKVVIAHRLSTVKNCDRIFVMDAGRVAEQGSYDELMEKKGLFYELAKRQIT